MIDCKEAARYIDRSDFDNLSFIEKLKLKFHNARCGQCRGYKKHSHILKSLFGDITTAQEYLSYDEKEEMKKKIKSST